MIETEKQENAVSNFIVICWPEQHFCQCYWFEHETPALVVVCSLPTAAICCLSWQMATVPESDSGLTAGVIKSQSIQTIHGLCACAQLLWHVWSTWAEHTDESFYTYAVFPSGNVDNNKDKESEKYIFDFYTDYMFGLLCFPLHIWRKIRPWSPQHWNSCSLGFLKRHPEIQGLHWGGQKVEFIGIFLIIQSQKIKPQIFNKNTRLWYCGKQNRQTIFCSNFSPYHSN